MPPESKCIAGFLHKFEFEQVLQDGVYERCSRCHEAMFFPNDTPNEEYLKYHMRSALQPDDPLYEHEYVTYHHNLYD